MPLKSNIAYISRTSGKPCHQRRPECPKFFGSDLQRLWCQAARSLTFEILASAKSSHLTSNGISHLAPKRTAHDYFIMLDRSGALKRIHETLYIAAREQASKKANPTVAIVDIQSAKAAEKGALKLTRKAMTRAEGSRDARDTFAPTRPVFC